MSALLMGRAMYVPLDMASRLVLVALADHANDDGSEARPGLRRITVKTGLSRRSVQRCLAHLEKHGLIEAAGYRRGGHGKTTNWRLAPLTLRTFADWYEDDPDGYETRFMNAFKNSDRVTPFPIYSDMWCKQQCHLEQFTVTGVAPQPSGPIKNRADFQVEEVEPLLPGESQWERARRIAER